MSGTEQAKTALAALADDDTATDGDSEQQSEVAQRVIDRAVASRDYIEAAAIFLEEVGLSRLDRAVEHAERELRHRAAAGREARAAFERYREAAAADHFHHARDTSLGGAGVRHDE